MRSGKSRAQKSHVNCEMLQCSHCVVRVGLTRVAHERNREVHVEVLKSVTETC